MDSYICCQKPIPSNIIIDFNIHNNCLICNYIGIHLGAVVIMLPQALGVWTLAQVVLPVQMRTLVAHTWLE
jgi:hypothetical protein